MNPEMQQFTASVIEGLNNLFKKLNDAEGNV